MTSYVSGQICPNCKNPNYIKLVPASIFWTTPNMKTNTTGASGMIYVCDQDGVSFSK